MTFSEVEKRYVILKSQLNSKQITPKQFNAKVSQLRFQDKQGRWWQIHATDGQWIAWNGTAWVAASPPERSRPAVSQEVAVAAISSSKAPQTLVQLLKMVLKNILKRGLLMIPMSIGLALLTMIVHTFLLVGPNGGFGSGVSPILDSVLALQGKVISGTLFWALLTGLATAIFARLRQVGIAGTIRGIQAAPAWVRDSFQVVGFSAPGMLLGSAALTLLAGTLIDNRLVSLQFVVAAIGALIAQQQSFSYLVMSVAWSDSQRLLKRTPTRFNPAWAGIGITGVIFGFGGATILPFAPYLGCAGSMILIGIALALILMQKNKSGMGVTLLILGVLLSLTLVTTPVFADDGGWDEAGGTFSSWVGSEGAATAVAHGVPPSVGAAVGAMVGSSLIGIGGMASGGGTPVPIPVPQSQVPVTPPTPPISPPLSPDDQWKQEWIQKGWAWSDADDGFVPKSGATNDQNQVWCHPPWDQGGSYWVDKAEYDDIQEHLSNGDAWSDRWGWKPPEEINQLDQERDDRWNKFTDPAESQKRHDQMMQRIEQDLANDPTMMEFEKIQQRLDNMKYESLRQDVEFHQKTADYYNKKAALYDKLHAGASVVKTGADFAIDTLGMAPGGGRVVKYTYKFISNTAQTSIETGSLSQGLTKGAIETGKAVIGDKIGDNLSVPGVDSPTVWAKIPAKDFIKKVASSPYDAKQLVLNKIVDSKISDGLNRFENGVHSIIDNPED